VKARLLIKCKVCGQLFDCKQNKSRVTYRTCSPECRESLQKLAAMTRPDDDVVSDIDMEYRKAVVRHNSEILDGRKRGELREMDW
jgi:hypothetical protein